MLPAVSSGLLILDGLLFRATLLLPRRMYVSHTLPRRTISAGLQVEPQLHPLSAILVMMLLVKVGMQILLVVYLLRNHHLGTTKRNQNSEIPYVR
jgi:hypothetical protein